MATQQSLILVAIASALLSCMTTTVFFKLEYFLPTEGYGSVLAPQKRPCLVEELFACRKCARTKNNATLRRPRTLSQVWENHKGYISVKWANYILAYEEEFSRLRAQKRHVVVLEIGVGTGGSLQIWREYFGPESEIIGVDINPKTCTDLKYGAGITVHCLDVNNADAVMSIFGLYQFDVIIDDAGHQSEALIKTFETLFHKLRPGGVYAMEDVASVYGSHGMRVKDSSLIEYMKDLVDMTSMWEIFWQLHGLPPFVTPFQKEMGMWIQSIAFQENMIIVRKLPSAKSASFDVLRTGQTIEVGPGDAVAYFEEIRLKPLSQRANGLGTLSIQPQRT